VRRILSWFLPISFLLSALALPAAPAAAQITLPLPTITSNSLSIPLSVAGLLANLNLTFETVTHMNLLNLGVSVRLVTFLDTALLARLPPNVSLPVGLPIVVKIEPPAAGGLTFTGLVNLRMVSLSLPPTSDLRLYGAPLGGKFTDLTDIEGDTTYRVAGTRGGFSEFLVVVDHTPLAQAVSTKLDALSGVLTANAAAIAPPVRTELTTELAAVRAHVTAGQISAAIQEVDAFLATAERHSGAEIPDVWSAAHDRVDVAGQLRAGGRTLRYSLNLERAGGS
jgi:hypothetical protein